MDELKKAFRMIDWGEFSVKRGHCPRCSTQTFFVKLNATDIAVRCLSCRSSLVTLSLINVMNTVTGDLSSRCVYELSARGTLVEFLKEVCGNLTCSEFLDEIEPGHCKNGVMCQDVQKLTFEDCSFDVCTSLEVFEHVPDDAKGFSEIHRVLKPEGVFVFTVPIDMNVDTVERATIDEHGNVVHLTAPEYHLDPLRGNAPILAFRTYGLNLVEKLVDAGFERAEIRSSTLSNLWGEGRPVIVGYKTWPPEKKPELYPLVLHSATRQ